MSQTRGSRTAQRDENQKRDSQTDHTGLIDELIARNTALSQQNENMAKQIAELTAQIGHISTQLTAMNENNTKLIANNTAQTQQIAALTKQIEELTANKTHKAKRKSPPFPSTNPVSQLSNNSTRNMDVLQTDTIDVDDYAYSDEQGSSTAAATNTNSAHTEERATAKTPKPPPVLRSWADITNNESGAKPKTATTHNNNGKTPEAPKSAANGKPSPIQLGQMDKPAYEAISNGLYAKTNGTGYQWQQVSANSLPRIFAENAEIKQAIMDWLMAKKIEFNTYADRGTKQKAFLVRGIAFGNDTENTQLIHDALRGVGVKGKITVSRFLTPHMKRNPNPNATPVYKATVAHEALDASIAGIHQIMNFRVKLERMKPSAIIQCHRCQRYAHTSSGCAHQYRCVQCVHQHLPGCCPRSTNKSLPLGCTNCQAAGLNFAGHTANDHQNCAYYNTLTANRAATRQNNKKSTRQKTEAHGPSKTNHTVPFLGITEAVQANNPNDKKKRPVPKVGDAKTVEDKKTEGKSNGNSAKKGKAMGQLIAALMNVLSQFQ